MTDADLIAALDAFESLPEDEAAASLGLRRGELRTRVFAAREAVAADHGLVFKGCRPIRAELAVAPDGVARRARLRTHVLDCPGCAAWAEEVERQRDARVVPGRRMTTLRNHPRFRRAMTAVAVSAVAATSGYVGVGALQGTPTSPEAPVAAAASDRPAPKKEHKQRAERRTQPRTTATTPSPVTASSVPPSQPQQAPAPQPTPERNAAKQQKPKKPKKDKAAKAGGFVAEPEDTGGIVAIDD